MAKISLGGMDRTICIAESGQIPIFHFVLIKELNFLIESHGTIPMSSLIPLHFIILLFSVSSRFDNMD